MRELPERTARILDLDPDLAELLPPQRREDARRHALVRVVTLSRGLLAPELVEQDGLRGFLLLDGLVSRNVRLADTTTVQLLAAGDLLGPATEAPRDRLVPIAVDWFVLERTEAALIDDGFIARAQRWPELLVALFERVGAQSARLGTHCAISQLARVEDRLEALLWLLAERWGRIGPHGVVVPLRLTHAVLGQMLGARRPTVSLALRELEQEGVLHRRSDGAWVLHERWHDPSALAERPGGGVRFLPGPQPRTAPPPAPPPPAAAPPDLAARIERMRTLHASTREQVDETLVHSERARDSSAALRRRLRRDRPAAPVP